MIVGSVTTPLFDGSERRAEQQSAGDGAGDEWQRCDGQRSGGRYAAVLGDGGSGGARQRRSAMGMAGGGGGSMIGRQRGHSAVTRRRREGEVEAAALVTGTA